MLNAEGPVETARLGGNAVQAEAGKADLVVRELNRYSIKVAAQYNKYVINTSGRRD